MDALAAWKHLSGYLTADEWQDFANSDDGLWLRARVEGFKGLGMRRLVDAGKKRRAQAWDIARDMATNIIGAEIEELELDVPPENKSVLIERLAEKLMCEQSIIPPRFSKLVQCESCGPVHAPEDTDPVTPNCPWCEVC